MPKLWITLFASLLLSTAAAAAAPPVRSDPLKGVVYGKELVTCNLVNGIDVYAFVHSLSENKQTRGRCCSFSKQIPLRWQLAHGAFWVSLSFLGSSPGPLNVGDACLQRIDLRVFSKGDDIFLRDDAQFTSETPAGNLTFQAFDPRYFLYFDFLPAGKVQTRHFMTTNLTSDFDDRNEEFEDGKTPASLFYSHICEGEWDAKEKVWNPKPWKLEWSAPAAFREPFQTLALGDDFYFVTRSGALFRAAKPAKGTDRVLTPIWAGKKQPISSFITDAATNKTFLFVPPGKEDGRPAFFELSDKPKLVEYDPKLVPLPKLAEPHRTILHRARILVALKHIKGELPAKDAEKKKP